MNDNQNYLNPYGASAPGQPVQGFQPYGGYPAQHPAPFPQFPAGYPMQQPTQGMAPGQYPADPSYANAASQGSAYPAPQTSSLFDFTNDRFLKGLLIGAAATYILTNETVQRTAIKGAVKAWSLLQGGAEEIKERFQDAEAEIRTAQASND